METVKGHFNKIAPSYDFYKDKHRFYYSYLKSFLVSKIPAKKTVLEIGCGTGDLLAATGPKRGYGVDLSPEMIKIARQKHSGKKNLHFATIWPEGRFDYIFMSDVIEHLDDPNPIFQKASKLMSQNSVFVVTMANPIWEPLLLIGEKLGYKMPEGPHKRISFNQIKSILRQSGLKILKHDYKLLVPIKIPLITEFANKYLERYFKKLCFIEYFFVVKS